MRAKKVGILALQGAFAEHRAVLERLKIETREVKLPRDLEGLDGLIIPGGESTTIGKLLTTYELWDPLLQLASLGFPILGTCAGLILMAKEASDLPFATLGLMDIKVRRNAYGRQVDSFEVDLTIPNLGDTPFPGVFIRAPIIEGVGDGVEVIARIPNGEPVAVKQGKFLAATFHPELTRDPRFHAFFLNLISGENGK